MLKTPRHGFGCVRQLRFGRHGRAAQIGCEVVLVIHQGHVEPPSPQRLRRIPRGAGASAELAGGFVSKPPGNWLVTKLFFGDDEGEVFLDLNPMEGAGGFSIKDVEYASVVMTELASVMR